MIKLNCHNNFMTDMNSEELLERHDFKKCNIFFVIQMTLLL